MYSIIVNGQSETCETNKKLMDFLREDLGLTGTKDGCNQGSCGACTVLVNGKASKACLFTLEKLAGKEVTTIEGFKPTAKRCLCLCVCKNGCSSVRVLHPWDGYFGTRIIEQETRTHKRRHSESYTRKHLSLYRICENNRSHSVSC